MPAVAVNVADVDPAGTVTEAATGSVLLLLDRATAVPPLGAACASATVQVEVAPEVKLVGEHCSEDKLGCQFATVMLPEAADMVAAAPLAKAAQGPLTTMGTVGPLVSGARVTVTVATMQLPIVTSFNPTVKHMTEPLTELQLSVLPALASAGPAATTTELTSLGTNESVHSKPAGALPPLNERFSETEPPSTADPDARLRESV